MTRDYTVVTATYCSLGHMGPAHINQSPFVSCLCPLLASHRPHYPQWSGTDMSTEEVLLYKNVYLWCHFHSPRYHK
uniref:Uncharacterized protein n=1 Tax=Anguilla anguilla TaxID=7936 RepID=A0A0E9SNB6_ANGAN